MPKQSRSAASTNRLVGALPPCFGPKLQRFPHWNAPIEWLERLDEHRDDNPVSDGYVFKVKIKSRFYAVKVFKFFDPEVSRWYWEPYLGESFPIETVAFHIDPFYAECRAYGRIDEKRKNLRPIAVPCHGYILLADADAASLEDRGIDLNKAQINGELLRRRAFTDRARAIVKDLAAPESGVGRASLQGILKDIYQLNKIKIYNRDIRAENFRGGRLVDFGSSLTEPHCMMDAFEQKDKEEAVDTRLEDLVMFDDMVEEQGIETKIKATTSVEHCQRLRSWSNS